MNCLVCGYPDASTLCPRCGTDLRLLSGESGEARLVIAPTDPDMHLAQERGERKSAKRQA